MYLSVLKYVTYSIRQFYFNYCECKHFSITWMFYPFPLHDDGKLLLITGKAWVLDGLE